MKISIITAVYNRKKTIGQAMRSVQDQRGVQIEHIVQDGQSTDGTLEVIDRYANADTVLISEPDRGIYDAINKGIARATGDVIGLLHSDDFFASPFVLEKISRAFSDPDVRGVYGDLDYVKAEDTDKIVRRWRSGTFHQNKLRRGWMPPHPTLYLRRSVFERLGLYDVSYQISADYDAMLRYFRHGEINVEYIPQVLIKMRTGGVSNRSLRHIIIKSREDYRAIKRNKIGGIRTLFMKNASKIQQFATRDQRLR